MMMRKLVARALAATAMTVSFSPAASARDETVSRQTIRRGEYLVTVGGCNDCHTPWTMGANGPAPDTTRLLSGHPQDIDIAAAPSPTPAPWSVLIAASMTAFAGPWGVSFSANLTPDQETGLGKWTSQNFIQSMRTGRHMGRGRKVLPPMPFYDYAKMTDPDLVAMFAYLQSLPALKNRVPEPIPPTK